MACELKEFIIFGLVLALGKLNFRVLNMFDLILLFFFLIKGIPIYLFYGLRHSKLALNGI